MLNLLCLMIHTLIFVIQNGKVILANANWENWQVYVNLSNKKLLQAYSRAPSSNGIVSMNFQFRQKSEISVTLNRYTFQLLFCLLHHLLSLLIPHVDVTASAGINIQYNIPCSFGSDFFTHIPELQHNLHLSYLWRINNKGDNCSKKFKAEGWDSYWCGKILSASNWHRCINFTIIFYQCSEMAS